jgi:hypothetical protein
MAVIIKLGEIRKARAMRVVNERVAALFAQAAAYRTKHRIGPDADTDWLEAEHRPLFLLLCAAYGPAEFIKAGFEPWLNERGELTWRKPADYH